ncbi:MAG: hypothetical protein HY818_11180 [Acetobacterium woodii]|nr:hypothetical protein [Acetobacterium woodii]
MTSFSDDQYIGTVLSKDGNNTDLVAGEKFDGTKAYTATITLSAMPNYGFTDSPVFIVEGADSIMQNVDSDNKTATITAVYNVKDQFRINNGIAHCLVWAQRAATSVAAEMLMRADLSVLAPGKTADIIDVTGNPFADITVMEQEDFVMKPGTI